MARRSKKKRGYTRGQWNLLIDAALHPYFSEGWFVLLDSLLHMWVEREDLPESVRKLVRYNLKHILASLKRKAEQEEVLRTLEEILRSL